MATYTLSGTGTQALSSGVVALHVTISTLPPVVGSGSANPPDYYGIGSIRPGDASAFWEPFAILGGPQWMPLPFGTTRIGYGLVDPVVLSVAEVFTPAPLAFPLASLPDVALSSPSVAEVLTYNGTKWANAAPAGGGGGGGPTTETIVLSSSSATISFTSSISAAEWLEVHWVARTTVAGNNAVGLRFNGDAGTNYRWNHLYVEGGSVAANGGSGQTYAWIGECGGPTGGASVRPNGGVAWVSQPANASWWKLVSSNCVENYSGGMYGLRGWSEWMSTAAATSVAMIATGGSFDVGSRFQLTVH